MNRAVGWNPPPRLDGWMMASSPLAKSAPAADRGEDLAVFANDLQGSRRRVGPTGGSAP